MVACPVAITGSMDETVGALVVMPVGSLSLG